MFGNKIHKPRLNVFSNDEIVVLDCAVHEDEGMWHDEEKEEVRKLLAYELAAEIKRRGIIPLEREEE